jgi:GAF domain-containing protein
MNAKLLHATTTSDGRRARVAALQAMAVLDTPPTEGFDALTRLAAKVCDTPVALVSLIDGDRLWFKSVHGIEATSFDGSNSFCHEVAFSKRLLEVPDPRADPRFMNSGLVIGQHGFRYYAGAPIMHNQVGIGTVCVLDYVPRALGARTLQSLVEMAHIAAALLKARMEAFAMFSDVRPGGVR